MFKGKYDPDGALDWLKEIERIFSVMDCTPAQKVRYGTHMLAVEADDWWLETCHRLEAVGEMSLGLCSVGNSSGSTFLKTSVVRRRLSLLR